jgi:hypothetical protein
LRELLYTLDVTPTEHREQIGSEILDFVVRYPNLAAAELIWMSRAPGPKSYLEAALQGLNLDGTPERVTKAELASMKPATKAVM